MSFDGPLLKVKLDQNGGLATGDKRLPTLMPRSVVLIN